MHASAGYYVQPGVPARACQRRLLRAARSARACMPAQATTCSQECPRMHASAGCPAYSIHAPSAAAALAAAGDASSMARRRARRPCRAADTFTSG